jgi:hypothetical protein
MRALSRYRYIYVVVFVVVYHYLSGVHSNGNENDVPLLSKLVN